MKELHRMDEFTLWGCAIAKALGVGLQTFLDSYRTNISRRHEELVAQDLVCLAVIQLMSSRLSWQGAFQSVLGIGGHRESRRIR